MHQLHTYDAGTQQCPVIRDLTLQFALQSVYLLTELLCLFTLLPHILRKTTHSAWMHAEGYKHTHRPTPSDERIHS